MRIVTKIMLIGVVLTCLVVVCTGKYYLTETHNRNMSRQLNTIYVATALNLGELYADGLQSEQAIRNIILNPNDEKAAQNFQKAMAEFDKVYARSLDTVKGNDLAAKLEHTRPLWDQGAEVKRKVLDLVKQGSSAEAIEMLVKEETPKWRAFKDNILLLQEDVKKTLTEKSHSIEERSSAAFRFNIAVFMLTVAVTLGLLLLLAFGLRRRLNQFNELLEDVAQGEGDLTRRIDARGSDELGRLGNNLNQFIDKTHDLVKHVVERSIQIVIASNNVHILSEEIARESDGLANQAAAVATASEEMSATSNDIARNCMQAAEEGNVASDAARDGSSIVQDTVAGMGRIADRVRNAATTVASLGARSDQIGEIVGTIEDIADQTNLLALNAAIEAARAGEQGRGFAVVADEVRALAVRTTKATSEIGVMIRTIQNETKNAVESMDQGVSEVAKGSSEAARSGDALLNIINQINDVTMQISQIATAAEEQTATTSEISGNILQVTEIARRTSDGTHKTNEASNQLLTMAEELMATLGKFKINEDTALVLNKAKSAHMLFVGRIKAHLDGLKKVDPETLPSHLTCVFGKWYQSSGQEKCGHTSLFREIDAPHAKVHDLGKQSIQAYNAGDKGRAFSLSDEMTANSLKLIGILEQLEQDCRS